MTESQIIEQAGWFYLEYEQALKRLMDRPDCDTLLRLWLSQHDNKRQMVKLLNNSPSGRGMVELLAEQVDRTGRVLFEIWDDPWDE